MSASVFPAARKAPSSKFINGHVAIVGATDTGKTTIARAMVVHALRELKVPAAVIAYDPMSQWEDLADYTGDIPELWTLLHEVPPPKFFVVEEASDFEDPDTLKHMLMRGRHYGAAVIMIGHRPTTLVKTARAQVSTWVSTRLDIDDLVELAKNAAAPRELVTRAIELPRFHAIRCHAGKVDMLHVAEDGTLEAHPLPPPPERD